MRVVEYVVFHPWRVGIAVLLGIILGAGAFYVYQVQAAFNAVASEDFDPDAARMALGAAPGEAMFVEPDEFEVTDGTFPPPDLASESAELKARWNLDGPFDPRVVNPNAFGDPIDDELFDSYLLVGTDASGFLADSIILALQPEGEDPIMVSLPRDLYVWNACKKTFTRLNAGLGGCTGIASGMEMLALMVEDYTGVPVDHMVRVNFAGFASVVNAMGGTTICVDYPTRDWRAELEITKTGCSYANGSTTLAWVRSRHTEQYIDGQWRQVAGSDYARQNRQQDVLFQLAARARRFSSPASLTSTLSAISGSVRLDSGWTLGEAVATGWRYRGIKKDSVSRFSIAATNYRTPAGAQVLIPSQPFSEELSEVYTVPTDV